MRYKLLAATALSWAFFTSPVLADAETEALRAQVKLLEARLDALEKQQHQQPAPGSYSPSAGASASEPEKKLENRVAVLERNQELSQEDAKAKAEKNPSVEIGNKGFVITSPDKQYSVRMRAYAQADNRTFFNNGQGGGTNTFLIRSARPTIDAKMTDYFSGRIMLDFGQGNSRLLDAYADFKPDPTSDLFNLRGGKFKVPLGLERWQSEQEILFVERGLSTNLVPFRDIGGMAFGQIIPDQLEYQFAVSNGAADLADNNADTDNSKDFIGRVFAHPFRWSDISWLQGFGVGVAGSYGNHKGTTAAPGLVAGYVAPGQRTFFSYRTAAGTTVFADGTQTRINPQAYYYHGPFSLLGEYVSDKQAVNRGGTRANLTNTAWLGIATYVLTGEDASFDGVKPAHNFSPSNNQWGAFEILGRVGKLDVDNDAFPFYADATASATEAFESTLGATWYLNQSVKLNLDYSWTQFDGGAVVGDREDEKVLLTRAQFRF